MNKLYTLFLVLLVHCCQGQDITKKMTSAEANVIISSLSGHHPDSIKFNKVIRLAYYQILKAGEHKRDLDSAKKYLDQALILISESNNSLQKSMIYTAQSHYFREKGMHSKGRQSIEHAINFLHTKGNKEMLGLAFLEKSQYYDYTLPKDLPVKIRLVHFAAEYFRESGNLNLMAYSLKMLADLHCFVGSEKLALEEAKLALKTYERTGERKLQGIYALIGSIYYENGNYVKGLNYQLKAINTARSERDTTMQFCQICNGIGMTYMRLKKFPDAIRYLKAALPIALHNGERSTVITLAFNIVECYIPQNKHLEALSFLRSLPKRYTLIKDLSKDFPLAVIYLELYTLTKNVSEGIPYSKQLGYITKLPTTNVTFKQFIYIGLIKFYIVARDFKHGQEYLVKNEKLLSRLQDASNRVNNYQMWFKIDTLQRKYKSAVRHLLLQKHLSDSIALENQKGDLKRITSFYESAQKENILKLLQARNRLQQIQIEHINYSRKWFAGLLVTLFALLGFLIWRYLEKRKTNAILSLKYSTTRRVNQSLTDQRSELIAENETLMTQKEWLLSEVHHRVRNNLHTVVSLLESQAVFLKNDALEAIEKSQHRIYVMSLVHQKLYDDEHLKVVDFSELIPELTRYLNDYYGAQREIQFSLDIAAVKITISQAIPLALIMNEAITNAMLHAFKKNAAGKISINVHRSTGFIRVSIADNGIGIDSAKMGIRSSTLGLVLMEGLSNDIGAMINIENDQGTKVSINFQAERSDSGRANTKEAEH